MQIVLDLPPLNQCLSEITTLLNGWWLQPVLIFWLSQHSDGMCLQSCVLGNQFVHRTGCSTPQSHDQLLQPSCQLPKKVKMAEKVAGCWSPQATHSSTIALMPCQLLAHPDSLHLHYASLAPPCTLPDPHCSILTPLHLHLPSPAAATRLSAGQGLATSCWLPHRLWLWESSRKLPHLTIVRYPGLQGLLWLSNAVALYDCIA